MIPERRATFSFMVNCGMMASTSSNEGPLDRMTVILLDWGGREREREREVRRWMEDRDRNRDERRWRAEEQHQSEERGVSSIRSKTLWRNTFL